MTSPVSRSTRHAPSTCTSSAAWRQIAALAISRHDCQQLPGELAPLLEYLNDVLKPVTVLEIGGWAGGSAWAWGCVSSVRRIVTVTLPDSPMAVNGYQPAAWHQVIYGDSTSPITAMRTAIAVNRAPVDFLWVDGNHEYDYARSDYRVYGQLVRPGGLIGMHDINDFPNHPTLQVHRLWAEITDERECSELIERPGADAGTGLVYL